MAGFDRLVIDSFPELLLILQSNPVHLLPELGREFCIITCGIQFIDEVDGNIVSNLQVHAQIGSELV